MDMYWSWSVFFGTFFLGLILLFIYDVYLKKPEEVTPIVSFDYSDIMHLRNILKDVQFIAPCLHQYFRVNDFLCCFETEYVMNVKADKKKIRFERGTEWKISFYDSGNMSLKQIEMFIKTWQSKSRLLVQ